MLTRWVTSSPLEIILDEQNSYGDDYITYNFNRQECRRLFLDCADPTRVALQRAIERNDVVCLNMTKLTTVLLTAHRRLHNPFYTTLVV